MFICRVGKRGDRLDIDHGWDGLKRQDPLPDSMPGTGSMLVRRREAEHLATRFRCEDCDQSTEV